MDNNRKPVIMVSSVVYGIEDLLENIYALLISMGYEVWMSYKGTIPILPDKTAFDNCLKAVENCDIFLSLIVPFYGSGKDDSMERSIIHEELIKAVRLDKPRWVLAHDHVVFARSFLRKLGYKTKTKRDSLNLEKSDIFEDLRLIDMYETAVKHDIGLLRKRRGNWVQKFFTGPDAVLFAYSQFSRFRDVEAFLKKQEIPDGGQ